jgi:hypothetical protein
MTFARPLIAAAVLILGSPLLAAANCPEAPESQWIHIIDLQKKIVNEYGLVCRPLTATSRQLIAIPESA